ncbi:NAD(P)/FAD-dependent oxidoreductase [Sorangium sp. So ce1000]|uniref:NAD(P)/FAD-dependent oxidoreductase n=1 Tax=Sorangium sp. So ce1000 TaxID=3133325 RepID=UPI003F63BE7F
MEHVVIIGAGFGGLYAARALRHEPVRVTVIDRHNHHTFQPLLYQVATAGLSASDIATPIRHILRKQKNTSVILAEVKAIDPVQKRVIFEDGELGYDKLIVAAGASHSYFGHDAWEAVAPGLKTVEDALEIRRRVLVAFEAAEREPDPALRSAWMTFVVVGGGPTGVELAGALSELARHTLVREFRHIDPSKARILLLEGAGQVLPTYVPELGERARQQLEALNVEVRTDCRVTDIDEEGVSIGDKRIDAKTVLWGAGVAASSLARALGAPLDRAGRVLVAPDLTVPGHEDIYVIGDLASLKQEDGTPVPGVAPAAIQGGRHAALNIARTLRGLPRLPFRYNDRGSMATIGRAAAVADFGKLKLSGFLAWLAWLFVHILFLIGFRNRFLVLFSWALSYVTYQRASRLITGEIPPLLLEDHHARALEARKDDGAVRRSQPMEPARTRA